MSEAAGRTSEIVTGLCPFGPKLQRYWDDRYDLFTRFDGGVWIDEQGLYSVKPEALALQIGRTLTGQLVLDAFCGVGGSAIGLARAGKRVVAADIDTTRLEMARHNVRIYGVEERVTFYHGDWSEALEQNPIDSVYLDPEWGGPEYIKAPLFSLAGFRPDGSTLLERAFSHTDTVAITLPVNFDLRELAPFRRDFFIQWGWLRDRVLFSTAYFGLSGVGGPSSISG